MKYWIISNNRKDFDPFEYFKIHKEVSWKPRPKNVEIGDFVYIYITLPIAKIKFKCKVKKIIDSETMLLVVVKKYDDLKDLSLKKLEKYGLKRQSLQSQQVAPKEIVSYIEGGNIKKQECTKNYLLQKKLEVKDVEKNLEKLKGKEKHAIVKIRINQGKYRKNLLNKYGYKCLLCGISLEKLLIASHIKPWKVSNSKEKVDIYNGLILCPIHDKLFDQGLISFDDVGKILISDELNKINQNFCNVNKNVKIKFEEESKKYMKYHREKIFKRN